MQSAATTRVLTIGQDNLFAGLPDCTVDHVPTGASITPRGARGSALGRLPAILARVCLGKYDLIVLPAVDFRWQYDGSFAKRTVRRMLAGVLRFRPTSACVNGLLSHRRTRVIVLDRYDSHEVLVDYLGCITSACRYFKTNLRAADSNRVIGGGRLSFLPYWIGIENYQVPFRPDKDIDVFFAGTVNSEERRVALSLVRRLEPRGYRIKIVEGLLPFADYLAFMSRSWLTLSPQGYGYNGFRHYESMLVGSVPLINRPDPDIISDFVHGENCFLYSPASGDLTDVIENALRDRGRLQRLSRELRQFVVDHHSMRGVASYLLQHALECRDADANPAVPVRSDAEPLEVHPSFDSVKKANAPC